MLSSQYVNMEGQSWVMERGLLVARLRLDFFPLSRSLSLCEGLSLCLPCLSLCLTQSLIHHTLFHSTSASTLSLHTSTYPLLSLFTSAYRFLSLHLQMSVHLYHFSFSISNELPAHITRHEANLFHPSIPMSLLTLLHSM